MINKNIDAGNGWFLLPEGTPLKPGDGFMHPDWPGIWVDYASRPDIFRGAGHWRTSYFVRKNETAHTYPWRRKVRQA